MGTCPTPGKTKSFAIRDTSDEAADCGPVGGAAWQTALRDVLPSDPPLVGVALLPLVVAMPNKGARKNRQSARRFPVSYVTTDVVLFTIRDDTLQVVLVERGGNPPGYALPGGFLEEDEDLDRCAIRELAEETGIRLKRTDLRQLASYGAPDRDPRYLDRPGERVVTVAWWGIVPNLPEPRGGSDARRALLVPVARLQGRRRLALAFDHALIFRDALERVRATLENETIANRLCGVAFTIPELRRVYEVVWNCSAGELSAKNFERRVRNLEGPDGFVEDLGRVRAGGRGRSLRLYRAGAGTRIHPPLLRPDGKGEGGRIGGRR